MPDPIPTQYATVPLNALHDEQWDLAMLLFQAVQRPLTFDEVNAELEKLRQLIRGAETTWH